jgi:hypothetical protein
MEIIAVCSENQSQYINIARGRKVEFLNCSGIWFIWSDSCADKQSSIRKSFSRSRILKVLSSSSDIIYNINLIPEIFKEINGIKFTHKIY